MAMTPKEALIKDGTISVKEGRGRLSREAVDRCKYLVSQGWDIKGYERQAAKPADVAPTATNISTPVEVKKVAVNNVKEVKEFAIFYPEESFKAVSKSGKVYSMREVCNTCRVSLVQNSCMFPTILGSIAIEIKPK